MKSVYNILIKISDGIFYIEKWLLLVAVVVAVSINFLNVVLRYLFKSGISCCEMLSIVLFMFMVVIGGNIAIKTDGEIRIDIYHSESDKKNAIFRLFSDVISICALLFGIVGLFNTIQAVLVNQQKVTPLPIYTYHIYIVMEIGFVMMLLDHIIVFLRHLLIISGEKIEGVPKTE